MWCLRNRGRWNNRSHSRHARWFRRRRRRGHYLRDLAVQIYAHSAPARFHNEGRHHGFLPCCSRSGKDNLPLPGLDGLHGGGEGSKLLFPLRARDALLLETSLHPDIGSLFDFAQKLGKSLGSRGSDLLQWIVEKLDEAVEKPWEERDELEVWNGVEKVDPLDEELACKSALRVDALREQRDKAREGEGRVARE
ncbi:hypothetical protein BC936DRAFT_143095 [Jimgerdemannia flammicorona]|uniref:Uncharacterized protein n=2 Tax=Jimgerdemannia flammicorona TaxID=994334 RepID=A0A433QQU1_9FUNG|nr:hypothetical protein BC936DRAFT_143095 [Jimgerdemannia flammicorona]RUS32163.1 hypothetical protein BC938DRAFT_476122 [Jimgerdemannia flammicorona]